MITTVWLLMFVTSFERSPTTYVIERFATETECRRVADWLNKVRPAHACIQATILLTPR